VDLEILPCVSSILPWGFSFVCHCSRVVVDVRRGVEILNQLDFLG
jgi:hypothetical protein